MAELGTVERAYADGYAAAQHEIGRLQELLRSTGANRYWEGRWRDEYAEKQECLLANNAKELQILKLRAAMKDAWEAIMAGDSMDAAGTLSRALT